MYFNFRVFFRLAYLSFLRWRDSHSPLTIKRIIFLIGFFTIFPIVQLFNALCFLLDEILFPGYRKLQLKKPVFIVGNPRSGTTFIHRVMAKDEEHFFCFRTWEIMFPAIIQKKVLACIGRIDQLIGSIVSNWVKRCEARLFHNFNKMHQLGLFIPEEDDKLLVHIFSSFDLILFFPFMEEFAWLAFFDKLASFEDRRRIMTFYKNCIKRQAYFKGNKGQFLSKSPHSSSKIGSLYEFFPGCKIIYMVRNPLEVIPSMINMAHEIWHATSNVKAGYPFQDAVYDSAKFNYEYALARLEQAPQGSHVTINYEDLVREPSRVIQTIYQRFDFEITSEFSQTLREEDEKAESYKSGHVYSLTQFRFKREKIVSDLRNIFDRFGFDPGESTGGQNE